MRQSQATVALIRPVHDGQNLWLAQWNPKWRQFHFVSAHRRPDETFRECLVREIAEELELGEERTSRFRATKSVPISQASWISSNQIATYGKRPSFHPRDLVRALILHAAPENGQGDHNLRRCINASGGARRRQIRFDLVGRPPQVTLMGLSREKVSNPHHHAR